MKTANRVLLNTMVSYLSLILSLVIGLFSVRITLDALGEINYGVYNVVAGIVIMLNLLQSNMTSTSMRFLAHSLGSNDQEKILKTFNSTLFIHLICGLIVICLLEIAGIVMFQFFLNIPQDKILDAKIVYQFMIVTSFVAVISVPYDAVMNAHEHIFVLSLVTILGNILHLTIAFVLLYSTTNKLILYGFLMMATELVLRFIKQYFSKKHYPECRSSFKSNIDKPLIKSMLSFTGWDMLQSSIFFMLRSGIKDVLLNMFFGVRLNAAEGIASNVSSKLDSVSEIMTRAINPQIMKSEGGGNRKRMISVSALAAKYSTFLYAIFSIPVLLEANYLLGIWLKKIPDYAVIFCQLAIIRILTSKPTQQLDIAIKAVGNIKNYMITLSILWISAILAIYFSFKYGGGPTSVYKVMIASYIIVGIIRLYFGKKNAGINIAGFITNAVLPSILPMLVSVAVISYIIRNFDESFARLCITFLGYGFIYFCLFWFFAVPKTEKERFSEIGKSIFAKLKKL